MIENKIFLKHHNQNQYRYYGDGNASQTVDIWERMKQKGKPKVGCIVKSVLYRNKRYKLDKIEYDKNIVKYFWSEEQWLRI